jgi:hypothetical protein
MEKENILQAELSVFEQHKQEWLRSNPGEFVVIVGEKVVGFHPDYESAFKSGLAAAGLGKFLLKQVWAEEPVYLIYGRFHFEVATEPGQTPLGRSPYRNCH